MQNPGVGKCKKRRMAPPLCKTAFSEINPAAKWAGYFCKQPFSPDKNLQGF
jgi:hypothetical protein